MNEKHLYNISTDDEHAHLESDLVKAYLTSHKINHIDLTKINVITGKQRSKPIPTSVRQQVGGNTKFIEITRLPSKKSWNVGSELWVNLANPAMRRVYNTLQSGNLDENQIKCVAILFSLLAHNYDKAVSEVANWLDS